MKYEYRLEEVALILGCSAKTINTWYKFKKENPDNEMVKLLPEYMWEGNTRKWSKSGIQKLQKFQSKIVRGRNGMMGSVNTVYWHKKRGEVNG